MITSQSKSFYVFGLLALLMLCTRFGHVGSDSGLPDASWAVFFMAGLYLPRRWHFVFPALMLLGVLVDLLAIRYFGVSNYCLSLAYWFIVPASALLWLGGRWLQPRFSLDARGAALLAGSLVLAVSASFLITNASFYWLSGRVLDASLAGWIDNLAQWYFHFLLVGFGYVGAAVLLQLAAGQINGAAASVKLPGGSR